MASTTSESEGKKELPASSVDYICWKHQRMSLHELRLWMGEARFLEFMMMFAGSYIILPDSKRVQELYWDYMAALTVKRIKEARKKHDIHEWNKQEGILQRIARKTKRKYRSVYGRGELILRQLAKVAEWAKGLKVWEKKYLKGDDDEPSVGQ